MAGVGDDPCESDADCASGSVCMSGSCFAIPTGVCEDRDNDGFFRGPGCPPGEEIDCDDTNAAINPSVPEICDDGVDQNCFGGPDEGCDCSEFGFGSSRDCGFGECAGIQTCTEAGWGECVGARSRPEECGESGFGNGLDEDCNGVVDDGCGVLFCPPRLDGMGDEVICPDEATCSSNGICF